MHTGEGDRSDLPLVLTNWGVQRRQDGTHGQADLRLGRKGLGGEATCVCQATLQSCGSANFKAVHPMYFQHACFPDLGK